MYPGNPGYPYPQAYPNAPAGMMGPGGVPLQPGQQQQQQFAPHAPYPMPPHMQPQYPGQYPPGAPGYPVYPGMAPQQMYAQSPGVVGAPGAPPSAAPSAGANAAPPSPTGPILEPVEEPWLPSIEDSLILDQWLEELDPTHSGVISGAVAVGFLKRSNLSRELLRDIWALVDSGNRGSISHQQFYTVMRLVSIACSPIYFGSKPTLERYRSTLKSSIPLPAMKSEKETVKSAASTPTDTTAKPPATAVAPAVAPVMAPVPVSVAHVAAVVPQTTVVPPYVPVPQLEFWNPSPADVAAITAWLQELDPAYSGVISGAAAVGFLKRSNLSREVLRDIWALVDSGNRGSISHQQFYTVMRLVSLACDPAHAGTAPSLQLYHATARLPIPLPSMISETVAVAPSAPVISTAATATTPRVEIPSINVVDQTSITADTTSVNKSSNSGDLPQLEFWNPSPADVAAITAWLQELDPAYSGVISGAAAVGFLKRSNLSREVLRDIWALVDSGNRGSISHQQFYTVMRLVSLACDPAHAGTAPSLQAYHSTANELIKLPEMTPLIASSSSNGSISAPVAQQDATQAKPFPMAIEVRALPTPEVPVEKKVEIVFDPWTPSPEDVATIEGWIHEIDPSRSGFVSGAVAVGFLKRSNLSREVLRDIWALVDSGNRGSISHQQFYTVMRLVSIACSPIYFGSKPTVERYRSTLTSEFPLPPMLATSAPVESQAPASVNSVSSGDQFGDFTSSTSSVLKPSSPMPVRSQAFQKEAKSIDQFMSNISVDPLSNHQASLQQLKSSNDETDFLSMTPAMSAVAPSGSMDKMSVFDSIVEFDLKANNEDWDDFADASTAPVQEVVEAPTAATTTEVANTFGNFESPATDFGSFSDVAAPQSQVDFGAFSDGTGASATFLESKNEVFGTFTAPTSNPGVAVDPSARSDKLSVFDVIVESDLKVNNEDWDEFADASTAPVQENVSNLAATAPNAFGDFESPATEFGSFSDMATPQPHADFGAFSDATTVSQPGDLFAGSTGSSEMPETSSILGSGVDTFAAFTVPSLSVSNEAALGFDAFPDNIPATNETIPIFAAATAPEDEDFGGFEGSPNNISSFDAFPVEEPSSSLSAFANQESLIESKTDAGIAQEVPSAVDPFAALIGTPDSTSLSGDAFVSGVSDSEKKSELQQEVSSGFDAFPDVQLTADEQIMSSGAETDQSPAKEEEDFGDFGGHEASPDQDTKDAPVPETVPDKNLAIEPIADPFAGLDDEFAVAEAALPSLLPIDKFLSVTPVAAQASTPKTVNILDLFSPPTQPAEVSPIVSSTFDLFPSQPTRVEVSDPFTEPTGSKIDPFDADFGEFTAPENAPTDAFAPSDFGDFTAPVKASSDDFSFGDFSGSAAATATVPVANFSNVSTDASSKTDFGDFGAFEGTKTAISDPFASPPNPPPSQSKIIATAPTSPVAAANSPSVAEHINSRLPNPVNRPMNHDELEIIASFLFERNELVDAFECCKQAVAVQQLRELGIKKAHAVEQDDLELAMNLKNEISVARHSIRGIEEETKWLANAKNLAGKRASQIDQVRESVEVINAINPSVANSISSSFLSKSFSAASYYWSGSSSAKGSSGSELLAKITTALTVRRSLRLIIATQTSNTEQPKHWKLLLDSAIPMISKAIANAKSFPTLSETDKNSVMKDATMQTFVRGMLKICEMTIYVAVSCLETGVEINLARTAISNVESFGKLAMSIWPNYYEEAPVPQVESIVISAALLSERNAGVTYCHLAMRPVDVTDKDGAQLLHGVTTCTYRGAPYLQSAVNYWIHNISPDPPVSEFSSE